MSVDLLSSSAPKQWIYLASRKKWYNREAGRTSHGSW